MPFLPLLYTNTNTSYCCRFGSRTRAPNGGGWTRRVEAGSTACCSRGTTTSRPRTCPRRTATRTAWSPAAESKPNLNPNLNLNLESKPESKPESKRIQGCHEPEAGRPQSQQRHYASSCVPTNKDKGIWSVCWMLYSLVDQLRLVAPTTGPTYGSISS